jgi:spore coat polysaccharide biosynthesis protein SpsF
MSRTGIVLQARMSSSRLPGKVLKPLCGRPMLAWIIDRLRLCRHADTVILATSERSDDDPVAALAIQAGIAVFRGSLDDVLDRFLRCAQTHDLDTIVRATGDNPFVDPEEIDRLITFFHQGRLDYAQAFPAFGSGLPIGIGTEIMSRRALARSHAEGLKPHHREHVNEYIQENPDLFPQATAPTPDHKHAPTLSVTVDTAAQFERAEDLLRRFLAENPAGQISTPWLIAHAK